MVANVVCAMATVGMMMIGASPEVRSLYAIDSTGKEHLIGPATNQRVCLLGAFRATQGIPDGITANLGPGPWHFLCKPKNHFSPGWDKVNPGKK
jgi:hypothetical protein